MRLLTVLLFGMFLVAVQIFLVLKAMQSNLFESTVDVVNSLVDRQTPIRDALTPQERAWIEEHPVIRVGIDPDFFPMEKIDSNGHHLGISPDYLRVVQKLTGLTFSIAPTQNWAETSAQAAAKEIDVFSAAAETKHRAEYMLFTPSYITLPGIIVSRQSATQPNIKSLKDLAGKRVAVMDRYSWHDFLEERHPEIIPVPVKTALEGLQKVAFGEVDAMIDYQFNITETLNSSGISNLRVAGVIDAPYGHSFGIRKDWPELHSILTKALHRIRPEERRVIAHKWLRPYEEDKTLSKQTIWIMLFAAEVIFAVFAFVLYWNFALKRQVARRTAQLKQELTKYDRAEKALRESRAMLEQSNMELEHRVNERTRDLQAINAELTLAKEAADAATVAKSQFLANISHEVRTPLHGIMAFAELALLKKKTPPHRYLRAILQSSRALLEIINDLLDVSKIEAGHLELEQAPFMLDDVVHHVCTVAMHNAHAGGIELVVDMEPSMPLALIGDAGRLQQILMNLVTNAVKFTGPGGQICVSLSQGNDNTRNAQAEHASLQEEGKTMQVICFVRDTGVGIAPEFLSQLFQPFRQVDASTTRRHGGTGLGLCICRQLVDMMHGEIWVESELDVGSTFAFSIPFLVQDESPLPASTPDTPPACMLILSASPLQTEVLQRHCAALGIQTLAAVSTGEALQKAGSQKPTMLLIDRKLAEPDALSALRILRSALGTTLPAILMDEHAGEQILSEHASHPTIAGQVAILPIVTLRGLREAVATLNKPCLVAYTGRQHSLPEPMETPSFQDVHILVAEDNPTNQEIIEALFEDTGVDLTIVSNGKQAIDALCVGARRGERFDLVLMDVQMPVMDGYEATRLIRGMPELEGIPIVAITAHAMHEDKMRALSMGITRYLCKPLSRAALFGTLRAILPHKIRRVSPEEQIEANSLPLDASVRLTENNLCGLDAEAITRLNVSPTTYQKILRGFVRNTHKTLPTMRRMIFIEETEGCTVLADPMWDTLIREAHNLKGAAANVGATAVQQVAMELEHAAKHFSQEEHTEEITITHFMPLFARLEQYFTVIQDAVQENTPESYSDADRQGNVSSTEPTASEALLGDKASEALSPLPADSPVVEELYTALNLADPDRISAALPLLAPLVSPALMEALQNDVDSYDYDKALALIERQCLSDTKA